MKYLITGVTGAIGYPLIQHLLISNNEVCVVLNPDSDRNQHIIDISGIKIIFHDINKLDSLIINERYDVFIHMAWIGGNKRNDFEINIMSMNITLKAINLANSLGCKTFISTGSQGECGQHSGTISEAEECIPNNAFGFAKYSAYIMSKLKCDEIGMRFIWLRVLSVYGEYDRKDSMIYKLIYNYIHKHEILKLSHGEQFWDYIHADDVATAIRILSENDNANGLYVIGYDDKIKLKEYVKIVANLLDFDFNKAITAGDTLNTYDLISNSNKLRKLGWKPEVNFTNGAQRLISKIRQSNVSI